MTAAVLNLITALVVLAVFAGYAVYRHREYRARQRAAHREILRAHQLLP